MVSETQLKLVSQAFSKIDRTIYDGYGSDNIITWARNIVYKHVFNYLKKGDRVLDLAAGTGFDTVFLASRGFRVHAIDVSPKMVKETQAKIKKEELENLATCQELSFTNLHEIDDQKFDYVLSNFGGLNCIPDLSIVTRKLEMVLNPNSYVTFVIMPPICPWELAVLPRSPKIASRRLPSLFGRGVPSKIKTTHFTSYYFSPREVKRYFGPKFTKIDQQGLCVFTPPLFKDKDNFSENHNKLFKALKKLDSKLSRKFPFNSMGDFVITTMQYSG